MPSTAVQLAGSQPLAVGTGSPGLPARVRKHSVLATVWTARLEFGAQASGGSGDAFQGAACKMKVDPCWPLEDTRRNAVAAGLGGGKHGKQG